MRLLIAAIALATAAACSPAGTEVAETNDLTITQDASINPVIAYKDAFIMEPIGGRDMTMGGVTIDVSAADTKLVAASSPSIGAIELHTMAMIDGKMTMRQVEGFEVKSGEQLELKRGGNHFMMFDVGTDVVGGETVDITLEFDTGAEETLKIVVPAEVRVVGE
ncbi:MAG: copper chaperone PCu(A)C [Henriciella sp.]|nr:copper chaperone PCu(A)C [Henriciella sp.]